MSLITHLSSMAEHDRLLAAKKDKLIVIDFHATWCGPCHAIAPKYETMSTTYRDATFCKVDVDKAQDIAKHYSIRASQYTHHNSLFRYLESFFTSRPTTTLPTFVLIKNAQKIEEVKGANAPAIEAAIRRHTASSSGQGPVFPGQGHTLSGSAPPRTEGEGGGFGYLKVILVVGLLWLWVSYARKADAVDAEVLGL